MPPKSASLTQSAIEKLIKQRVDAVIATERDRHVNVEGSASGARGGAGTPVVRECTLAGFIKCNLVIFHGIKGDVELRRWFEKTKMIFGISLEAANGISWTEIKKLMTKEFCLPEEIQRMEHELWNLKVKDFNMAAYTKRFNELTFLCPSMVPTVEKTIKAYIRWFTDNIKGEVTSSKPTGLNEAVRIAHKLME
ncbi:putative reverse transcriptase domain-containing protein [Tanacetum coccineum]